MKFFFRGIIDLAKHASKTAHNLDKKLIEQNVSGIQPAGVTIVGSFFGVRASVVRHDLASKTHAECEVERIKAVGGEPQMEIMVTTSDDKWISDGIITHEYSWHTRDLSAELQNRVR